MQHAQYFFRGHYSSPGRGWPLDVGERGAETSFVRQSGACRIRQILQGHLDLVIHRSISSLIGNDEGSALDLPL